MRNSFLGIKVAGKFVFIDRMVRLWIVIQSLTETTRVRLAIRLCKILIALKDEGYFSTKKVVKKKDIKKTQGLGRLLNGLFMYVSNYIR